jgi:hypothetical protein
MLVRPSSRRRRLVNEKARVELHGKVQKKNVHTSANNAFACSQEGEAREEEEE